MFAHVFTQAVSTGVGAATQLTRVGSFARVAKQVLLQVAQLGKGLGTDVTGIRSFASVCTHVSF